MRLGKTELQEIEDAYEKVLQKEKEQQQASEAQNKATENTQKTDK